MPSSACLVLVKAGLIGSFLRNDCGWKLANLHSQFGEPSLPHDQSGSAAGTLCPCLDQFRHLPAKSGLRPFRAVIPGNHNFQSLLAQIALSKQH